MADKTLTDLLYAFSLGCLEDNNKNILSEYLRTNSDYPFQELGEYQNLVALLPVLLEIEEPDPSLKDRVARKLYQVQEELKNSKTVEPESRIIKEEIKKEEIIPDASGIHGIKFREGRIEPPKTQAENKFDEKETEESYEEFVESKSLEDTRKIKIETNVKMPQPPLPPPPPPSGRKGPIDSKSKKEDLFKIIEPEKFRLEEEKKPEISSPVQKDKGKDEAAQDADKKIEMPQPSKPPLMPPGKKEDKKREHESESFKMPDNFSIVEEEASKKKGDEPGDLAELEIEKRGWSQQNKSAEEIPQHQENDTFKENSNNEPQTMKRRGSILPLLVILIILIAGGYFLYHNLSSNISDYQVKIDYLTKELNDLKQQITESGNNSDQFDIKNSKIVDLKPAAHHEGESGKLILNFQSKKGYMQLEGMPPLNSDQAYQLWVISNSKVISLGVFNPAENNSSLYPLSIPKLDNTQNLNFVLTIEPSIGSGTPSRNVFLTGSIR